MNNYIEDVNKKALQPRDKYILTIREAAMYFNIGIKKLRRLAEKYEGTFSLYMGNRYLIVRVKFEDYIDELLKAKFEERMKKNS